MILCELSLTEFRGGSSALLTPNTHLRVGGVDAVCALRHRYAVLAGVRKLYVPNAPACGSRSYIPSHIGPDLRGSSDVHHNRTGYCPARCHHACRLQAAELSSIGSALSPSRD